VKIAQIAYTQTLGLPLILWGGIVSFLMLALTFAIGFLNSRGIRIIKFKYHKPTAYVAILLVIIHGLLAMLAYLGY